MTITPQLQAAYVVSCDESAAFNRAVHAAEQANKRLKQAHDEEVQARLAVEWALMVEPAE